MYREAGARRRVYFNPQHASWNYNIGRPVYPSESVTFGISQCMEKVEVATATKGSVELLKLSAKTQEKIFYSLYTI